MYVFGKLTSTTLCYGDAMNDRQLLQALEAATPAWPEEDLPPGPSPLGPGWASVARAYIRDIRHRLETPAEDEAIRWLHEVLAQEDARIEIRQHGGHFELTLRPFGRAAWCSTADTIPLAAGAMKKWVEENGGIDKLLRAPGR